MQIGQVVICIVSDIGSKMIALYFIGGAAIFFIVALFASFFEEDQDNSY